RIWVSRIGNTSFEMQHELSQNGKVAVTVEAVVVMFSNDQQPTPISQKVRDVLETSMAQRTKTWRNSSKTAGSYSFTRIKQKNANGSNFPHYLALFTTTKPTKEDLI